MCCCLLFFYFYVFWFFYSNESEMCYDIKRAYINDSNLLMFY